MIQKRVYRLNEMSWEILRKDFAKKVFGKTLIPEELTDIKVVLTKVEPGGAFSLHKDPYYHILYFIEGEGEGWLEDETYQIKPGTVVNVPAGVSHGYKNMGEENLLLLTMNIPTS
ncbi:MAG: cupin domain-containing protein [Candidatus Hodarchaeota archaeon]